MKTQLPKDSVNTGIPKITPRPMLTGYTQALVYIGGVAVVATIIVGGYFGWMAFHQPAKAPVTKTSTVPSKPNYGGLYRGTSTVGYGLADITITVTGTTINGNATYNGTYEGTAVSGPVNILGTVSDSGAVSGGISGAISGGGQTATVGGSYSGQITGNTMVVGYSVSGAGQTYNSSANLTK